MPEAFEPSLFLFSFRSLPCMISPRLFVFFILFYARFPPITTFIWIRAFPLQTVQEDRESPFAISTSLYAQKPLICYTANQSALYSSPAPDPSIMHEHNSPVSEGVAVLLAQTALGRRPDMSKDQTTRGLRRETGEIWTVPGWDRRGENAWKIAEMGAGVVAYAEPIAVVRTSGVLSRACVLTSNPGNEEKHVTITLAHGQNWMTKLTRRRRESYDCVRIEWAGSSISFDSNISSFPL